MAIYLKDKRIVPYRGDYKPVNIYQEHRKIAGWVNSEKSGEALEWEDTYNDVLMGNIGGKSVQAMTVQGKNLFDWRKSAVVNASGAIVPAYGAIVNGIYTNQMSFYNTGAYITVPLRTINGGSIYTISFDVLAPVTQAIYFGVINTSGTRTNTFITAAAGVLTHMSMTVTAPSGYDYRQHIQLQGSASITPTAINVVFSNIQLEIGSTATAYAPFIPNSPGPDYPSPISSAAGTLTASGRNLFDKNTPPIIQGEHYSANGSPFSNALSYRSEFYINVKAGIQYCWNGIGILISTYDINKIHISRFSGSFHMIFNTGVAYVRVSSYQANYDFKDFIFMEGSVAHPYLPYRAPSSLTYALPGIPLPASAAEWTYIDEAGQKWWADTEEWGKFDGVWRWKKTQRRAKKILNGTEAWVASTVVADTSMYQFVLDPTYIGSNIYIVVLSSHFLYVNQLYSVSVEGIAGFLSSGGQYIRLRVKTATASTPAILKSWLAANTPEVEYQLATPVVTYHDDPPLATYPRYTAVSQDGEVKAHLQLTAKIIGG